MGKALHETNKPARYVARHVGRHDGRHDYLGGRTARASRERDWRRSMSDNVALALIVYTGLQIFVTVKAMREGLSSILPYLALVLLVVAIIPACRWFEKRWMNLDDAEARDPALGGEFRRDQLMLWAIAIGLPFAIAFGFRALA